MPNRQKSIGKSYATIGENTEDSSNDINMVMDKKFEEFKTYIISELTESVRQIIQTEVHGILRGYKGQLEKVTSTAEMMWYTLQHVSNLECENSVLQDKVKVYRQEFEYVVMKVISIADVSALE